MPNPKDMEFSGATQEADFVHSLKGKLGYLKDVCTDITAR
jgi:hypothetical protein